MFGGVTATRERAAASGLFSCYTTFSKQTKKYSKGLETRVRAAPANKYSIKTLGKHQGVTNKKEL